MKRKSVPIRIHVCVDCGVDLSGTNLRKKRCDNCRRIDFNRRMSEYKRTHKEKINKANIKWRRKNRKHCLEYLRGYMSRKRDSFFTVDDLVSLLRSNGGVISKSCLLESVYHEGRIMGHSLVCATRMGVVTIEGDVIRLIDTPLLCAVDGFYEEKLSKVKGEIQPIVDFDKGYHPTTIRKMKREGTYDTWRKTKEVM